ncbi:MAG: YidC/Oxa1 family membrane protein insertase [Candidatus Baltobacteraceae bacterium]
MEFLLASNVFLDPIVKVLESVLLALNAVTHNFGWTLIVLAVIVKLVLWPLNAMQFKSIAQMQVLQPKIKAIQAKHKGDPERLNKETMALYKEHGANPFASCLPLVLQMPILFSLYWAIIANKEQFAKTTWGWIGSPLSAATAHLFPFPLLANSLQQPDYVLLALYVVSMYFSVRFSSPAMDAQQAQQQKIMAFVSPVMIAFVGRFWPSALILYWLTFNVLSMGQQFWLLRQFPRPAPETKNVTPALANGADLVAKGARNGAGTTKPAKNGSPGSSPRSPRKRGSRRS